MRTKTEIIYNYPSGADEKYDGWSDPDVEKMMDEYAKESILDFLKWRETRYFVFGHMPSTNDGLVELYIQEKSSLK
jgi:hypothetical protein